MESQTSFQYSRFSDQQPARGIRAADHDHADDRALQVRRRGDGPEPVEQRQPARLTTHRDPVGSVFAQAAGVWPSADLQRVQPTGPSIQIQLRQNFPVGPQNPAGARGRLGRPARTADDFQLAVAIQVPAGKEL